MPIPIRCFTCGAVVGNKWERYRELMNEAKLTVEEILDRLNLRRSCCRTMILSHVELDEQKLRYDNLNHAISRPEPS